MSVLKPRNRTVYFRISEEEFHQLVNICPARGARSISELARTAMQEILRDNSREPEKQDVVEKLQSIDRTVSEMNQNLKRLIPSYPDKNGRSDA